jgi:hypothetical protein
MTHHGLVVHLDREVDFEMLLLFVDGLVKMSEAAEE